MDMPRICFVDDEPQILNGLRRMLRGRREVWEMMFFEDARRALAACEVEPASVVITDIRMPGMDGVALIDALRERCPGTVLFVLSGQSEEELGLRAAGAAHQFLSKPTDGATLIAAIEQALTLRDRLGQDRVTAVIAKLTSVPALPAAYAKLTAQLRHDPFDSIAIAAAVESDPGIATRLIQVANSSYYGAAKRITSARGAVQFLGVETLKSVVLTYGIVTQMMHETVAGIPVAGPLVARMLATAKLADHIARSIGMDAADRELAATVGLLADVGLLVLIDNFPDVFAEAGALDPLDVLRLGELEEEAFGVDHALVGAHLLATWGLPDGLTAAIADQAVGNVGMLATPGEVVALARRLVGGGEVPDGPWPLAEWSRVAAEALAAP